MKESEKIMHSERRDYSRADVVKYIEFKWNRRFKNSEHNSLIPMQVKIPSIAMPKSCPLVMQKTIYIYIYALTAEMRRSLLLYQQLVLTGVEVERVTKHGPNAQDGQRNAKSYNQH